MGKRPAAEEIVAKLRQVEVPCGQGKALAEAIRAMGHALPLAEGEGFEPSVSVSQYTGLANQRLKPLGHPSG